MICVAAWRLCFVYSSAPADVTSQRWPQRSQYYSVTLLALISHKPYTYLSDTLYSSHTGRKTNHIYTYFEPSALFHLSISSRHLVLCCGRPLIYVYGLSGHLYIYIYTSSVDIVPFSVLKRQRKHVPDVICNIR